jgi:hypothetical protein
MSDKNLQYRPNLDAGIVTRCSSSCSRRKADAFPVQFHARLSKLGFLDPDRDFGPNRSSEDSSTFLLTRQSGGAAVDSSEIRNRRP